MSRHALRTKDYLQHIVEAADRILDYTNGVSKDQFLSTPVLQDAVIRNIEVIVKQRKTYSPFLQKSPRVIPKSLLPRFTA